MSELKIYKDKILVTTSAFHEISADFRATKFPEAPLADTNVELQVPPFAITWDDRQRLVEDIAAIIRKYAI